jgi:3D (Asp-Asp-Asp) domain-containing protein
VKRLLAGLAMMATALLSSPASAAIDPIGELLQRLQDAGAAALKAPELLMRATLYHAGARGVGSRDSLGCRVSPMRTLAVDPSVMPKRSLVFIKETVGLPMPGGGVHDGLWYASDTGGAIKGQRIDLFTGTGAASMKAFFARGLNVRQLTVQRVSSFNGCPPLV